MSARALLLALCLAAPAGAAELGRLFASPAERAELNAKRDGQAGAAATDAAAPAVAAAAAPPPPPPPPLPTELNGVVRRSSGKSTVWLNQMPQTEPHNRLDDATLSLPLSSGRTVILKPGQSYTPGEASVRDLHGR
ncbi:hypothetical protein [Janthinobacterium fluminis]|uniref:Uncharacterized protein n=1 Tax=Janthinobacterium fluminis TaxID=2987524 RepID=A0ABT5K4H6_9BURK|nr:hypothetical protein [Janthinobacterium fluminis]MDC8759873.1 hypothetical protein [Janthinobacterium fluminis]